MSDNGNVVHCRPEVLTLQELARHRLPSPRFPSDLYREFFSSQRRYEEVVQALETDGFLRRRPDGTYRIWDAYRIMAGIMRHCRIVIPLWRPDRDAAAGSILDMNASWLPDLHFALPDDEAWWEAAEAANRGPQLARSPRCY